MHHIDENYFKSNDTMSKNTIEDILEPEEEILVRLKPSKPVLILESIFKALPIILLWLGVDIFAIIMSISNDSFNIGLIIFFAIHLIPVWVYIIGIFRSILGYKNMEYVLTNRRIIIRSGVIGIDLKSIFYTDITGVNVKVGFFDKMFKVGDLYLTATTQSEVLIDIKDPYFYLSKLQKITMDIKTDIYYPNDLRPKENHGYNTNYKGK